MIEMKMKRPAVAAGNMAGWAVFVRTRHENSPAWVSTIERMAARVGVSLELHVNSAAVSPGLYAAVHRVEHRAL